MQRSLMKALWYEWRENNISRLSAALAYCMIFSLAPILMITIAIVGLIFGNDAVQGHIFDQLSTTLGTQSALQIQLIIQNVSNPTSGLLASIVGAITFLLGISTLLIELQDCFNTIWNIQSIKLEDRILSIIIILGIGFWVLASILFSTLLAKISQHSSYLMIINFVVSIMTLTILFALIFKILTHVALRWQDVWPGALLTALFFTFGKFLLEFYFHQTHLASLYGASGSLVVILIWVYYCAQIFLTGVVFTKIFAVTYGSLKTD